jgi:hypothetical protein
MPARWVLPFEPLRQHFVLYVFKIGSHELFAWAGFEPQSSRSLDYRPAPWAPS